MNTLDDTARGIGPVNAVDTAGRSYTGIRSEANARSTVEYRPPDPPASSSTSAPLPPGEWLSSTEVGDVLGVTAARVSRFADLGQLEAHRGGMQGLDLACKLFVDPGDLVLLEGSTYTNGNATALSDGAELLEAPIDENGMVVEALPELVARAGRRPKAICTIQNFQNPSGVTLSLRRREQLLNLACEWGSVIIDDDPYGLLRFEGSRIPALNELDSGNPLIFSVPTFSTIPSPGLRVG